MTDPSTLEPAEPHYYASDPAGINPAVVWVLPNTQPLPPGFVVKTLSDYNAWVASQAALIVANDLSACLALKAVYDDLKASAHTVDWSEATFRALSGYTPGDC